jgi:hypothetical protein
MKLRLQLNRYQEEMKRESIIYPNITGSGFGWRGNRGMTLGNASISWPYFEWKQKDSVGKFNQLLNEFSVLKDFKYFEYGILSADDIHSLIAKQNFWRVLENFKKEFEIEIVVVVHLMNPYKHILETYKDKVVFDRYLESFDYFVEQIVGGSESNCLSVYEDLIQATRSASENNISFNICFENDEQTEFNVGQLLNYFNKTIEVPLEEVLASVEYDIFDIYFFRGMNSVSKELASILSWESSDILFMARNNSKKVKEGWLISDENLREINTRINQITNNLRDQIESTQIRDSLDSSSLVTALPQSLQTPLEQAFQMGLMIASSYTKGYVKWLLDRDRSKNSK